MDLSVLQVRSIQGSQSPLSVLQVRSIQGSQSPCITQDVLVSTGFFFLLLTGIRGYCAVLERKTCQTWPGCGLCIRRVSESGAVLYNLFISVLFSSCYFCACGRTCSAVQGDGLFLFAMGLVADECMPHSCLLVSLLC